MRMEKDPKEVEVLNPFDVADSDKESSDADLSFQDDIGTGFCELNNYMEQMDSHLISNDKKCF